MRPRKRSREELAELEEQGDPVCAERERPYETDRSPLARALDFHLQAGNRAASRAFAEAGSVQGLQRSATAAGTLTTDEAGGEEDLTPAGDEILLGEADVADQTPGIAAPDADAAIAADAGAGPGPDTAAPAPASPTADVGGPAADTSPAPTPDVTTQSPDAPGTRGPDTTTAAAPPVITSRTDMHAPDGTPDTRRTVAMGEVVYFDVGGEAVDWTASAGWPGRRTARSTFAWELPEPGTATITATNASGASASVTMTVIPPKDIRMRKLTEDPPGRSGRAGAGMMLSPAFAPSNVNFGNVEWLEVPGGPSNVSGYFSTEQAAGRANLNHQPNPNFLRIGPTLRDHAAAFGFRPPYAVGTWDWSIPNRFRRAATTGQGELYVTTLQTFRIDASGSITVSKQGASVSKAAIP